MKVWNVVREVDVDEDWESDTALMQMDSDGLPGPERGSEFRLAWLWVEGWRARLRKSGDVVEQNRWEWRLDHTMRTPNQVPVIVAKTPGVLVRQGRQTGRHRGREREKSVHWA